jgi:NADH-quinone oxidoreductase subunit D
MLTAEEASFGGCSGVRLRSTGVRWDLRKKRSYEVYSDIDFFVPIGRNGDCFDRFILRLYERRESIRLIKSCLEYLLLVGHISVAQEGVVGGREARKMDMESLIVHFKKMRIGGRQSYTAAEVFLSVEAPKGELGMFLVIMGGKHQCYRRGFKVPGLRHLFITDRIVENHLLADLVTVIGTQDIVFGEVDR